MVRLCEDGSLTAKHSYIIETTVTIWNENQHHEIRRMKISHKEPGQQNQQSLRYRLDDGAVLVPFQAEANNKHTKEHYLRCMDICEYTQGTALLLADEQDYY